MKTSPSKLKAKDLFEKKISFGAILKKVILTGKNTKLPFVLENPLVGSRPFVPWICQSTITVPNDEVALITLNVKLVP